jgi:magnesium-dependent phosphatase 1
MVICDIRLLINQQSAREALSLLLVPPKTGDDKSPVMPAIKFFDQLEIYPGTLAHCFGHITPLLTCKPTLHVLGSKIAHFKQLHKKTEIPYSEMVS